MEKDFNCEDVKSPVMLDIFLDSRPQKQKMYWTEKKSFRGITHNL